LKVSETITCFAMNSGKT